MDLLIVEILLWLGFALLIWALRDSLIQIENEFELRGPPTSAGQLSPHPVSASRPQQLIDPIGQYRGRTIHDYAIIDGRPYRFAYVCPLMQSGCLDSEQRWISPGLVYVECATPDSGVRGS